MSLDVWLSAVRPTEVFSYNITHNLAQMAQEAGLYMPLWRPEEAGIETAEELAPKLEEGLKLLRDAPEHFEKFNSPNGWGMYEHLVKFVEAYLKACRNNPDALITVSR